MSRGASGRSESTSSGCPSPTRMPKTGSSSSRFSDSPYWGDLWPASDLPLPYSRHTRPSSWDDSDDEPSPKSTPFNCPKPRIYSSDSAKSKDSVLSEINELKKHFFQSVESEKNSFLEAFERTPRKSMNEEDRRQSPARVRRRSKSSSNSSPTQELVNQLIELEEYKLETVLKLEEELQIDLENEKKPKKNLISKEESETDPKILLQNFFSELRPKRNNLVDANTDRKLENVQKQNNNVEHIQDVGIMKNDNLCRAYRKLSKILEIEEIKKELEEKENKPTEKIETTEKEQNEFKNEKPTFQVLTLVNPEKHVAVSDLHKSLSLEEVRISKNPEILKKFPERFSYSENEDVISLTAKIGKTEIGLGKSGSGWLNNNSFQFYPLKEPELEEPEVVKEMTNFHEILKLDLGRRSLNQTPRNEYQGSGRSLQSSEELPGSAISKDFFSLLGKESPTFKIKLDSSRSTKEVTKVTKNEEKNKRTGSSVDSSSRTSRPKTDSGTASPGSSKNFAEMTVLHFPITNCNDSTSKRSSTDSSKPSNTPLEQNRENWSSIEDVETAPSDTSNLSHREFQNAHVDLNSTRSAVGFALNVDGSQFIRKTNGSIKNKKTGEYEKSEKKTVSKPEENFFEKRISNPTARSLESEATKQKNTSIASFERKFGKSYPASPTSAGNSAVKKHLSFLTMDYPKRSPQKSSSRSHTKSEQFADSFGSSRSDLTTPKSFRLPSEFLSEEETKRKSESGRNSSERNSTRISNVSESSRKSNSSSRSSYFAGIENLVIDNLDSSQSAANDEQKSMKSVPSETRIGGRSDTKVKRERSVQSTTRTENARTFRSEYGKRSEVENVGSSGAESKEGQIPAAEPSEDEDGGVSASGRSAAEERQSESFRQENGRGRELDPETKAASDRPKGPERTEGAPAEDTTSREADESTAGTWTELIETFDGNQKPPIGFPMRRNFSGNSEAAEEEAEKSKGREGDPFGKRNSLKESEGAWHKRNREDPAPPHSQVFYFEVDKGERFVMGEFGDVTCWTVDKSKHCEVETPKDHGDGTNLGTTNWGILVPKTEAQKNGREGKDVAEIRMEDFTRPTSKWNVNGKEDNTVEAFYTLSSLKMSKSDNCLNIRQKHERFGQLYFKTEEKVKDFDAATDDSTENKEVAWESKSSLEENTEEESTESEVEVDTPKVDVLHKRKSVSTLNLGKNKMTESSKKRTKEEEEEKTMTNSKMFLEEKEKGRTKFNSWLTVKENRGKKKRKPRIKFGLLTEASEEREILPRHSSSISQLKLKNGCLKNFYKRIISVFCLTADSSSATSK